jgi:hypothetical protein
LTATDKALGEDAAVVLPSALRTREFTVRLPRYQIGALEVLAGDGRKSVEAMLTRMFEELAELHQHGSREPFPDSRRRWRGRRGKAL